MHPAVARKNHSGERQIARLHYACVTSPLSSIFQENYPCNQYLTADTRFNPSSPVLFL